jgi:hypothetical protein
MVKMCAKFKNTSDNPFTLLKVIPDTQRNKFDIHLFITGAGSIPMLVHY